LNSQAPEKNLFVDDVVAALTGPHDAAGRTNTAVRDQLRRAAEEFDQRTAEAFARALLESLCQDTIDVRRLEALLILGLAHPTILERHRISLRTEGRRLAAMLEHQGRYDRARNLLEVIEQKIGPDDGFLVESEESVEPSELDTEIEEYIRRADAAAARGRTNEAIRLLQDAVALDPRRRDLARMIRDLRWSAKERREKNVKRLKGLGVLLLLGAMGAGIYARESHLEATYGDIPQATNEPASLRARLDAVNELVAGNYVWFGMGPVLREQSRLRRELGSIEQKSAEAQHEAAIARAEREQQAEASRSRGMLLAQQGRFEEAAVDLRKCLELAEPNWTERRQVQANLDAIEAWIKKSH